MSKYREAVRAAYFKARRDGCRAVDVWCSAPFEAKYGYGRKRWVLPTTEHSERTELPNGWYFTVQIERDDDHEPPWEDCDVHGVVTRWQHHNETLENWELNSSFRSYRYYDWKASFKIALRDGWDAKPYRTGTRQERAMRAVKADYEYLRRWCHDEWWYVGWIVTLFDSDDTTLAEESCWGIESDATDYLASEVRDAAARMIREERKDRAAEKLQRRIDSRFREAMECGL